MKKTSLPRLLLLLVLLAAGGTSCIENDRMPEVSSFKTSKGDFINGKINLLSGETLTVSISETKGKFDKYLWFVNGELKSEGREFLFSAKEKGQYRIHFQGESRGYKSLEQEIGTVVVSSPAAILESLTVNGKNVENEKLQLPYTPSPLTLTANVSNVKVTSYTWLYGNEKVGEGKQNSIQQTFSRADTLTLILTNEDQIQSQYKFAIEGYFKEGVFFYGSTHEGLSFQSASKNEYTYGKEGNIYSEINNEEIGRGGVNDLFILEDRIYFLLPSSKSEKAQVVIADRQTLKKIDAISAIGLNTQKLGEIYNLAVVAHEKAYIGYNHSISGNISGVRVLNLKTKLLSEPIEGTSGKLGKDGPAWSRMITNGEDLLIACGEKLQVIDTKTDKVKKTISIGTNRQVVDIVKGKDKNIYLLVNGSIDKSNGAWMWGAEATSPASMVKLSPTDYSVLKEDLLLLNKEKIDIGAGLRSAYTCASPASDEIYFIEGGWSASQVYVYNYTSGEVKPFVNIGNHSDLLFDKFSGYMAVDKAGKVYIPTTNYMASRIGIFDAKGKIISGGHRAQGDASAATTYQFE